MKPNENYPTPVYHRKPNKKRTPQNEQLDLGWSRGSMTDGRPYYAEYWNEFGIDAMSYYFSTQGLEAQDVDGLTALLEQEGLIRILRFVGQGGGTGATLSRDMDEAGQEMWLYTIPVADEDEIFVECLHPIHGYGRTGRKSGGDKS